MRRAAALCAILPLQVSGPLAAESNAEDPLSGEFRYTGGGLVLSAPFTGRPDDQVGLAVAIAWNGGDNKQLTLAGGGSPANSEIEIELTYRFTLGDNLALQPDLQYVINPGGTGALKNALVLGIRLEIGFGLF